jgi:hypothetical protein
MGRSGVILTSDRVGAQPAVFVQLRLEVAKRNLGRFFILRSLRMNRSLSTIGMILVVLASVAPRMVVGAEPGPQDGWRVLFNGTDLTGWDGDPELWSVRDGVIHGETTTEKKADGNTFLIAKDLVLGDFELEATFRCSSINNSGIQYRSKHITEKPKNAWVVRGYQHELRNSTRFPDVSGFIYDEGGSRRRICLVGEQAEWTKAGKKVTGQLVDQDAYTKLFKVDDWNTVRIVAQGNRLKHFMNDTLVLDFTDDDAHVLREGVVALQLHAGAPMWTEFKSVRVRSLAPAD